MRKLSLLAVVLLLAACGSGGLGDLKGRNCNITDLERGDEISVRGSNSGGRYVANTITVMAGRDQPYRVTVTGNRIWPAGVL